MNIEVEKFGIVKVRKNNDWYSISDVISEYNRIHKKNRAIAHFPNSEENRMYVKEAIRLLNQFHKAKTFTEEGMIDIRKVKNEGDVYQRMFKNHFVHPILFARYMMWCFPEQDINTRRVVHDYIYIHLDGMVLKNFIGWVSAKYDFYFGEFDPLDLLREIVFVKKYIGEDETLLDRVILLNKSLIEVQVPFKDRVIVITKFFNSYVNNH